MIYYRIESRARRRYCFSFAFMMIYYRIESFCWSQQALGSRSLWWSTIELKVYSLGGSAYLSTIISRWSTIELKASISMIPFLPSLERWWSTIELKERRLSSHPGFVVCVLFGWSTIELKELYIHRSGQWILSPRMIYYRIESIHCSSCYWFTAV